MHCDDIKISDKHLDSTLHLNMFNKHTYLIFFNCLTCIIRYNSMINYFLFKNIKPEFFLNTYNFFFFCIPPMFSIYLELIIIDRQSIIIIN